MSTQPHNNGSPSSLIGKGAIIAAPSSGSGKTTITLGLLRALTRRGIDIRSAKAGPDYIDPQFHARASNCDCINLDPWAMRPEYLQYLAIELSGQGPLLIEGMMGLFDGAIDGTGSVADLANLLDLPVLLVVDAARQSHSIAALVEGFANHRKEVIVVGVILNKVGSERHEAMLRKALQPIGIPVLGAIRRNAELAMPERHLGLVQADEREDLSAFIELAADIIDQSIDIPALIDIFTKLEPKSSTSPQSLLPPGQRIAIARDNAFAFSYPHLINGWRAQGAEISFFSPLQDQAPDAAVDAIYLPGGYPELHAGQIAASSKFMKSLIAHAQKDTVIYGECGGYMVLGEGLVDKAGCRHKMAGLLPLVTSYEKPKLHLGYRVATPLIDFPFVRDRAKMSAHEFHYSTVEGSEKGEQLFEVYDAAGENKSLTGLRRANVMGSFIHLIDLHKN